MSIFFRLYRSLIHRLTVTCFSQFNEDLFSPRNGTVFLFVLQSTMKNSNVFLSTLCTALTSRGIGKSTMTNLNSCYCDSIFQWEIANNWKIGAEKSLLCMFEIRLRKKLWKPLQSSFRMIILKDGWTCIFNFVWSKYFGIRYGQS